MAKHLQLDTSGLVPTAVLPATSDEVELYAALVNLPATGVAGKLYIVTSTGSMYQWTGSAYALINTGATAATGWSDLVSPLTLAGVPSNNAPTAVPIGTSTTGSQYEALAFDVNDYAFCQPFHVNHDVKPNGKAYVHVHWTTNGTNIGAVRWMLTLRRALGHQQATFANTEIVREVEQTTTGTAWKHMVAEVNDAGAITLIEPDELILVTVKRIAPVGTATTDTVIGLTVDFHYETDRDSTPYRSPNFYVR